MQMRPKNEERRSKAWVIVMLASTIIIILAIAFFITKAVSGNPLKGEWVSEEKGYHLDVDDDEITVEATIDGQHIEVELHYTLDKNEKVVTLKSSTTAYAKAADDTNGKLSASDIDEYMSEFVTSYDYSIEGNKLILSKREYGNKYIFERIEK